jgi:ketosteroid isomerase-like protein
MKKLVLTFGIALMFSASLRADEFKTLIDNYWAAWSTLDPAKAAPMYDQSPTAVFFDIAPMKYNGWKEYQDGVKQVFAGAASASFGANDDLKSTRHGNIAWTSGTFHGTVKQKDGTTQQLAGRHTAIWEKRGDKWIIVHEHVSAPLP